MSDCDETGKEIGARVDINNQEQKAGYLEVFFHKLELNPRGKRPGEKLFKLFRETFL